MKISGDICIDFRDNSLEEIKSIKNFFKDNKEDYLWIKEGNLKDDIFLFSSKENKDIFDYDEVL